MSMVLRRLDHYNIETVRPEETVAFYCDVLGCVNAPERRPTFVVPGAWLLVDDHPAIHVNFVEEDRAGTTGAIDHVAFSATGYLEMCAHLDELGIEFETVELPQMDLMQIFVIDPNQIRVEINIRGENEAVAAARA
jgi:catechol 2,3-dioxygenase-like lactoylglutathione lyase family enzyme